MSKTPDRHPGDNTVIDQFASFSPQGISPSVNGEMAYVAGTGFQFYEEGTLKSLGAGGGGGISEAQHKTLDHLVHGIAEASYDQVVYTGNRVDAVVTWETSAMLKKIREELYVYSGGRVSTVTTRQYNGAGTLLETMTETLTYTGAQVTSIARAIA